MTSGNVTLFSLEKMERCKLGVIPNCLRGKFIHISLFGLSYVLGYIGLAVGSFSSLVIAGFVSNNVLGQETQRRR